MTRATAVAALVALSSLLLGVLTGPDTAGLVSAALVVAVAVVAIAVATAEPAALTVVGVADRQSDERARRGAFRRHSAPATGGRPQPRAPGRV